MGKRVLHFAYFWPYLANTCQQLAENLTRQTTPASISNLLSPDDVDQELPRGGGAAVLPPGGFQSKQILAKGHGPNQGPEIGRRLEQSQLKANSSKETRREGEGVKGAGLD